eukprot:CAMPEP_0179933210 /NCGR_PEP_ID=MMETSP0983-20121128/11727_1 /TAXON_ID=483367 /ORGANISM="non described non described, Strain CCMP 2436" /LENGTH=101 /DNA_ID=CAMNT_0021837961 /DNA_START=360 /DNA_END=661 /DNA_ORIENTATION=-
MVIVDDLDVLVPHVLHMCCLHRRLVRRVAADNGGPAVEVPRLWELPEHDALLWDRATEKDAHLLHGRVLWDAPEAQGGLPAQRRAGPQGAWSETRPNRCHR